MKLNTMIWAQMESKGRPVHTRRINDSVSRVILEFAKWMGEAYMGASIRLTIARTEAELEVALSRKTSNAPDGDMMTELTALLNEESYESLGCEATTGLRADQSELEI